MGGRLEVSFRLEKASNFQGYNEVDTKDRAKELATMTYKIVCFFYLRRQECWSIGGDLRCLRVRDLKTREGRNFWVGRVWEL